MKENEALSYGSVIQTCSVIWLEIATARTSSYVNAKTRPRRESMAVSLLSYPKGELNLLCPASEDFAS